MKFITVKRQVAGKHRHEQLRVQHNGAEYLACEAVIGGPAAVRHDPADPHGLGAHTWIETAAPVSLLGADDAVTCSLPAD